MYRKRHKLCLFVVSYLSFHPLACSRIMLRPCRLSTTLHTMNCTDIYWPLLTLKKGNFLEDMSFGRKENFLYIYIFFFLLLFLLFLIIIIQSVRHKLFVLFKMSIIGKRARAPIHFPFHFCVHNLFNRHLLHLKEAKCCAFGCCGG